MRFTQGGSVSMMMVGDEPHHKEWAEKSFRAICELCEQLMREAKDSKEFKNKAEAVVTVMNGLKNATAVAAVNIILEAFEEDNEPEVGPMATEISNELHDVLQNTVTKHTKHLYAGN